MSNVLTWRGYGAAVKFDKDDMLLVGRIAGINDIVSFHAESAGELVTAFREAVDDYLSFCEEIGKKPENEFSRNV